MSNKKGRLILIVGPSAVGKDTIISYIRRLRPEINLSISATTREQGDDEVDGLKYHFVTREKFHEMIKNEEFMEYTEYVGEYYGTPLVPIYESINNGADIILEIEVQGAKRVMEMHSEAVAIFLLPPNMEELERRMRGRNRNSDTEEKIQKRLQRASEEIEEVSCYSHVVVNDDISRAANEILSILGIDD